MIKLGLRRNRWSTRLTAPAVRNTATVGLAVPRHVASEDAGTRCVAARKRTRVGLAAAITAASLPFASVVLVGAPAASASTSVTALGLLAPATLQAAIASRPPAAASVLTADAVASARGSADVVVCGFSATRPVHQRNTGKNRKRFPYEIVGKGAIEVCLPHDPDVCRIQEQLLLGVPLPDGKIDWSTEATGRAEFKCPPPRVTASVTLLCRDRSGEPFWWKTRTLLTIDVDGHITAGHVDSPRLFSRC